MERSSGEIQRLSYFCEFYEKAQKKVAGSVPNWYTMKDLGFKGSDGSHAMGDFNLKKI